MNKMTYVYDDVRDMDLDSQVVDSVFENRKISVQIAAWRRILIVADIPENNAPEEDLDE